MKDTWYAKISVALAVHLFSSVGHVSGSTEILSLEEIVSKSQIIVIAEHIGKPKSAKSKDGIYSYFVQQFKVNKTLFPKDTALQMITVSDFNAYNYGIQKLSAEGKGNKIGIYSRYDSITQNPLGPNDKNSGEQILFLKKPSNQGSGDYEYVESGAYDSPNAQASVKAILDKLKN